MATFLEPSVSVCLCLHMADSSALSGEPPDLLEFERIDIVVDEEIGKQKLSAITIKREESNPK